VLENRELEAAAPTPRHGEAVADVTVVVNDLKRLKSVNEVFSHTFNFSLEAAFRSGRGPAPFRAELPFDLVASPPTRERSGHSAQQ